MIILFGFKASHFHIGNFEDSIGKNILFNDLDFEIKVE